MAPPPMKPMPVEALDNAGARRRVDARKVPSDERVGQQHVAAACHGHQRKGAQPHAVLDLLTFPSDGQRQQIRHDNLGGDRPKHLPVEQRTGPTHN